MSISPGLYPSRWARWRYIQVLVFSVTSALGRQLIRHNLPRQWHERCWWACLIWTRWWTATCEVEEAADLPSSLSAAHLTLTRSTPFSVSSEDSSKCSFDLRSVWTPVPCFLDAILARFPLAKKGVIGSGINSKLSEIRFRSRRANRDPRFLWWMAALFLHYQTQSNEM